MRANIGNAALPALSTNRKEETMKLYRVTYLVRKEGVMTSEIIRKGDSLFINLDSAREFYELKRCECVAYSTIPNIYGYCELYTPVIGGKGNVYVKGYIANHGKTISKYTFPEPK